VLIRAEQPRDEAWLEMPDPAGRPEPVRAGSAALRRQRCPTWGGLDPLRGHRVREDVHYGTPTSGVTPEYKDEAVKLNTGHPVATVARELGINEATLGPWVHDFRARPLRAREARAA
jgi:Transposase